MPGLVRIADGVANAQVVALFVEQVHGERVELNQPADELGNLLQQLVDVDDGRDLPAQIEQRQQDVSLAAGLRGGRRCRSGAGSFVERGGVTGIILGVGPEHS